MLLSDLTAYQFCIFTHMIDRGVSEASALRAIEGNIQRLAEYEQRDFTPEAAVNALLLESRQREEWTVHHLARMRAVILAVIDDGDPLRPESNSPRNGAWALYENSEVSETCATEQRVEFADAIQTEIVKQFTTGEPS